MSLAKELAEKYGFGTQHPAFRDAVDEAIERVCATFKPHMFDGDYSRAMNAIRAMKSEPTSEV